MDPLNKEYDEKEIMEAVSSGLSDFYASLTEKLNGVNIDDVLKRKNPYLYRARGINSAIEVVDTVLSAYISSSEETLFGNSFFEPIAIAASGGQKAMTEGADITVETDDHIYTIAVKSGTAVFNADSKKRQEENFRSAQKRAQQAHKVFFPVIGYGYGRKKVRKGSEKFYLELAGKDFWEWLTGDPGFYKKIITFMGDKPEKFKKQFDEAYANAENRMVRQFTLKYCSEDGSINWNKIVEYSSGAGTEAL